MNYTYEEIGKRIAAERQRAKLSQIALAKKLNLSKDSRQSVSRWENWKKRKVTPSLEHMVQLCKIFDCEMDYLFGEISERTHATTDICTETGLTAEAVERLRQWNITAHPAPEDGRSSDNIDASRVISFLNALLCSSELLELAILAQKRQDNMAWAVKHLEDNLFGAIWQKERLENGEHLDEREKAYIYTKAIDVSEKSLADSDFYAYQFSTLFSEFLTDYAGQNKRKIRELQDRLKKTQAELDKLRTAEGTATAHSE